MKNNPRVVFDTNIYISAIIFGGNPRSCLELARSNKIALYTSRKILLELARKLREKFDWNEEDIYDVLKGIVYFAEVIEPKEHFNLIKKDPADNRILECAFSANADFIISGDKKHLLSLKTFKNIPIISAKQFLDEFYR